MGVLFSNMFNDSGSKKSTLNLSAFGKFFIKNLVDISTLSIKKGDLVWEDGTKILDLSSEMARKYQEIVALKILPDSKYLKEMIFLFKLLDEGDFYLAKIVGITTAQMLKFKTLWFYEFFVKSYTGIDPIRNYEELVTEIENLGEDFSEFIAKLLYIEVVLSSMNKYRRNLVLWRRELISSEGNMPIEMKILLLLSDEPVTYSPAFEYRPRQPEILRLISDLQTFEIEMVVLIAIYLLTALEHPRVNRWGQLLSGSYQDAIDIIGYIVPMLYMLGLIDFANYLRSYTLEFLFKLSDNSYFNLSDYRKELNRSTKYQMLLQKFLENFISEHKRDFGNFTMRSRIKSLGSAVEKKRLSSLDRWIPDVVGFILIMEDEDWFKKYGLVGLWNLMLQLLNSVPKNIQFGHRDIKDADIEINYGSIEDIEKFIKTFVIKQDINNLERSKSVAGVYRFYFRGFKILVTPMRKSGYEAVHLTVDIDNVFGGEIKFMTRRSYYYQSYGLASHFLYKLDANIPARDALVQDYLEGVIDRDEFFKQANLIADSVGLSNVQRRGNEFLTYFSSRYLHGFVSPMSLNKILGYLEQNNELRWIYDLIKRTEADKLVKDPHFRSCDI